MRNSQEQEQAFVFQAHVGESHSFCSGNEHTVSWVLFWSFTCLNIHFLEQNLFLLTQIQLPLTVPCNINFFTKN